MIAFEPVADALGAEVRGVDLGRDLDGDEIAVLDAALVEHQVLFFRGQAITPAQQLAFARRFGPTQIHPAYPHVDGLPDVAILESTAAKPSKIEKWHTDMTFRPCPPLGTVLHARIVPAGVGDTEWMSLGAAYDALPDDVRRAIDGRRAEHSFEYGFRESLAEPGGRERLAEALAANPPVTHPAVRRHPVSGRKVLFVNCLFTTRLVDIGEHESRELLDYLFRHCEREEFRCRMRWGPNDIAFWDNRQTQHRPVNDFGAAHRKHHRVTIDGDTPV